MLAAQHVSSLPPAPPVWQNPQAGPLYPGSDYSATAAGQVQIPPGQVASWDPTMQAGRAPFVSAAGSFPGPNYAASSTPSYATSATPGGSLSLVQTSPVTSGVSSSVISHPGVPPNVRPDGASPPGVRHGGFSPPGHPPYYGQ